MSDQPDFFEQAKVALKRRIRRTVKTLYFPEVWYSVENFFQDARDKSVLDVGCGNSLVADALAKSGFEVTCVDPVLHCLRLAQKRFAVSGRTARFEQAEPNALPFADNTFGNLVSINMLEFTTAPELAVREMFRVLRPGGRMVIATFNRASPWGLASVARIVRRDKKTRHVIMYSKVTIGRLLTKAGFKVEQVAGKAKYLPTSTRVSRWNLPVTGAYIFLASKPRQGGEAQTSTKTPGS